MAKRTKIEWRGDEVKRRVRNAQMFGVNKTMAQCVVQAKNNHPWENVTGIAEASIRIYGFATPHARGVRGFWGSTDVVYFLRLELGFDGTDAAGRSISQPARPALRPAADAIYPRLAANIAEALR